MEAEVTELKWIKHDGGPMPVASDAYIFRVYDDKVEWPLEDFLSYTPVEAWSVAWDHGLKYAIVPATPVLTGGSSPYYSIDVNGVTIECNDVIKALELPYADGNVLKAVWRIAIDRMGRGKPGTTRLYDAEKIVFFGNDMVEREKANG